MSTRPGRPLVVAGALLLAIVGATVVAERVLGAPRREVELLAAFLSASGILSLVVGALAIRWAGRRIPSLHVRLTLAYGIGLVVALVNVVTTSVLMFLSAHDLALLSLLLVFAAVISVAFAYAVAGALTADLGALSHAAGRLAAGDLAARVGTRGSDEAGRLAVAFDDMADQLQQAFSRERALEAGRRERTHELHDHRRLFRAEEDLAGHR